MPTAYCWKQGKQHEHPDRPVCVLLNGHKNPCQVEVAPKETPDAKT